MALSGTYRAFALLGRQSTGIGATLAMGAKHLIIIVYGSDKNPETAWIDQLV
jgi:hypothetical protein